ncbi:MAG: hypothetical protein M0R48_09515, partial [Candidatus Omnitrophica bacterium]|nr:hypothetical protein [Candidatus Omnitrophota bacterium]
NFFKSLRIALNNCSIYFKEHPLFIKSIEKLHTDTLAVLNFIDPFIIGIAPISLSVAGKFLEKEALHIELAAFLHRRKIKNIEIRKGLTASETGIFLTSLSLPVLDIFKEGGLACLLEKQGIVNIIIEELDYSSLLRGQGQEQKDIWAYLLKRAVKEQNTIEIKNIVENFDTALEKIKITDFSENEDLRTSIAKFLNFLKAQEKENFNKCAKALVRAVSNSKEYTGKDKIKQLSFLADSLTPQDITDILCEEVTSRDAFNIKSIELFSSLLDRSQNAAVASALSRRLKEESGYNTTAVKKTKELLASLKEPSVQMIYQHALGSLLIDMGLAGSLSFDAEQMKKNYRIMLLNLFAEEKISSGLFQIAEMIYPELDKAFSEADINFARNFFELITKKINSGSGFRNILEEIKVNADKKLEEALLSQRIDVEGVIDFLSKTTFDKNFYLNKIFIEKDVNYNIFCLFFNFFPRYANDFYSEIKSNNSDINLLKKIIESLKSKDTKISCNILENVFYVASRFLKMEILKIMQNFSNYNENFIISILLREDLPVKRQIMAIVVKNNSLRQASANVLLSIPNSFGIKNKLINENINMIGEFKLTEAKAGLEKISKLKLFWKKSLKDSAHKVLDGWL